MKIASILLFLLSSACYSYDTVSCEDLSNMSVIAKMGRDSNISKVLAYSTIMQDAGNVSPTDRKRIDEMVVFIYTNKDFKSVSVKTSSFMIKDMCEHNVRFID